MYEQLFHFHLYSLLYGYKNTFKIGKYLCIPITQNEIHILKYNFWYILYGMPVTFV